MKIRCNIKTPKDVETYKELVEFCTDHNLKVERNDTRNYTVIEIYELETSPHDFASKIKQPIGVQSLLNHLTMMANRYGI